MNINKMFFSEQNYLTIKVSTLSNYIISLVIFANAFQIAFMSFGIYIDIWIEYVLIAILFAINKFRFNNSYNILLLAIIGGLFLFSIVFFYNQYSFIYLKEFVLYSAPIILVFMININYNDLSHVLYKCSLIGSLLYILILTLNNEAFALDYMTYGYHSIFFSTYVFIYSFYSKKRCSLIYSILTIILTLIYGPRGGLLVVGFMVAIMALFEVKKSLFKKIFLFATVLFFCIFGVSMAKAVLSTLIFKFKVDNYSVYQFYSMLSALNLRELLGSRYGIFDTALFFIKNEPLTGLGIGGFQSEMGVFPHNIVIDVFVTFGLALGLVFFLFNIFIGKKMLKFNNNIEIKILFIFIVSNLAKLLVSKTFIYDSMMWLYISFCISAYITYKKNLERI